MNKSSVSRVRKEESLETIPENEKEILLNRATLVYLIVLDLINNTDLKILNNQI